MKPRNRLPLSPMKIFAGLKLKIRKPPAAPAIAAATPVPAMPPEISEKPASTMAAMQEIPAESPSMLSSRLTALVIPMTHTNVSGRYR